MVKNMKKLLLVLLSLFLFCKLDAQKKDYAYCIHQIDSLTTIYSVDTIADINDYFSFEDTKLNLNEKKKIISKIQRLFKQKKYLNLYAFGGKLLRNLYFEQWKENTTEIQQNLMDIYLQYYFYPKSYYSLVRSAPNSSVVRSGPIIASRNNYSQKGERRLVELLEGKKTKEEYELYVKYYKSLALIHSESFLKQATFIMKQREIQNDTILMQITDSLHNAYIANNAKESFESLTIENELIRVTGLLDIKECIPILKQNLDSSLTTSIRGEPEKSYRYALARLGDKEQRQYILDNLMDFEEFDRQDFIYFQDDDMIWRYIDKNYHSNKRYFPFSHGEGFTADLKTMSDIYPFIKDLPIELEYPYSARGMDADYKWAKSLYEWLMSNKDKVEFDYKGEKDFPW